VSAEDVELVREALRALAPFGSGAEIATTYVDRGNAALARLEARIAELDPDGLAVSWKTTALLNADLADKAQARVVELQQELIEGDAAWGLARELLVEAGSADEAGEIAESLQKIESFGGHHIVGTGTAWIALTEQAANDGEDAQATEGTVT